MMGRGLRMHDGPFVTFVTVRRRDRATLSRGWLHHRPIRLILTSRRHCHRPARLESVELPRSSPTWASEGAVLGRLRCGVVVAGLAS
jgi:hypothetical protein